MATTPRSDAPPDGLIGHVTTLKVACVVCATILTGFALWALHRILEPLAMAVFLLIMVDGMARMIHRRVKRIPKALALPAAIALIVVVLGLTVWLTANNAGDFAAKLPVYTARIDALLGEGAQRLGLQVTPTAAELFHKFNPGRYAGDIARGVSHAGEDAVFVLVYLGFLVASRQGFEAKTRELFAAGPKRAEALRVFERIRRGVERYIWVQTLVGLIITALSAVLMAAVGLSHIAFWCLIIFLANYIPAIGAAIGVLFPAVFGLVELDGIWRIVVLLVGLEAVHFLVSHIVQPRLQGENLNLDPIVVLLALAFWGLVWGVPGAFLSTPLTVLVMVVLAEFKGTRPLAVLLSSDGKPFGHAH
ncbi:MAG TPA: AI-2E family transporter [Caulobacteraceae bacterium]|nr:AI-2E family transporter [Caulobacteraceae bacterium]